MKIAMTIAGSDSGGGAGIQADIKTMSMNGVFAVSAVTALTAQNTLGVSGIMETPPDFLAAQIDAVFTDLRPDAVKVGMAGSADSVRLIAERLSFYKARRIVVDPVMAATSGAVLAAPAAIEAIRNDLLPIADLITPNIPEAEILAGFEILSEADMEKASRVIGEKQNCAVLVKGGHQINDANDLLYDHGELLWFKGRRINNPNTHGTGCTLSSAIAANLAKGFSLAESIRRAKDYISEALACMLNLGAGSGPMNHLFSLKGVYAEEAKDEP